MAWICSKCGSSHEGNFDCKKFVHSTPDKPVLVTDVERDHLLLSVGDDSKAMTVEQYGSIRWSRGRELGQRDGLKQAAGAIERLAAEAFLAKKDDGARAMRDLAETIRKMSVTYKAPTDEEIKGGEW